MLKRLIPLFFILLLPHFLRAQDVAVYPIDVTAIITPPYGTCLKDYVGSRRFMVNVLLRDMTKRPDDFVIEMSVKNSGNRVVFRSYFGNLSLNPGKPFYQDSELQNGFISQLFDPNNILVGNQFATKCFDEGAYSISFQAFAAYNYPNRRIPLSRASTSTLFMQSTVQGPYLIFPYDKDSLDCSIATINYQWQSANPTGEAVSYHLQVVEVPEGFSGYNSFETATTFVENQPNLFHSTFQSIVSAAKYRPNTTYAWRVIVKTREHEHISPVRTFVYCGTPQAPVNEIPYDPILTFKPIDDKLHPLHIDSVDTTSISALAYWKKNPEIAPNEYCGIAVEVRKQGQEKWTPYRLETADTSKIQLENLSYGTLYEARGQYIKCDGEDFIYGPYGDTIQFIIPDPVRAADCGDDIPPLADCGDNKGKILGIGDTIFANGTNVIIDTVFYSGEDSTIISGKGHIEFPIIRNVHVKMEFNDIQINCAGQLAKGVISTIYDPSTSLMIDVEELIGQGSTGGADNPVSNSEVNKYDKESFDSSPEGSFFVKDDSTVVMKDENGTEVPIGKLISLSSDQYASKNSLLSPSHFLEFINLDPKNIAFDKDTFGYYSKIAPGDYHKYSEAGDRNYIIPWLANNPGKTKKLYVKEVLLDRKVSLFDSVKFVMPTNGDFIELNHTHLGEGFFSVDIPGGASTKNSFEVYALGKMKESSSYGDAGKLMVENYPTRKNKVIFVPIQNDYKLSNELEKSLNDIYGRLGITYEVELAEKFENELLQEILSDGLDISADDESRWQVESEEMKMLRYLYRQHLQEQGKDIEKNAAYIFLVDKAQEPYQSVEGDMPRNQSVGYIFMQGNTSLSDARLVAHELGHGVYRLQHTFDYKHAEEDKYKTDNLMDYNNGDFLAHYQWRVMQDSVMFVWKSLQEDEDGMAFREDGTKLICLSSERQDNLDLFKNYKYYYLPDGSIIDLEGCQPIRFYAEDDVTEKARGAINAFRYEGTTYELLYNSYSKIVTSFVFEVIGKNGKKIYPKSSCFKNRIIRNNIDEKKYNPVRVYVDDKNVKVKEFNKPASKLLFERTPSKGDNSCLSSFSVERFNKEDLVGNITNDPDPLTMISFLYSGSGKESTVVEYIQKLPKSLVVSLNSNGIIVELLRILTNSDEDMTEARQQAILKLLYCLDINYVEDVLEVLNSKYEYGTGDDWVIDHLISEMDDNYSEFVDLATDLYVKRYTYLENVFGHILNFNSVPNPRELFCVKLLEKLPEENYLHFIQFLQDNNSKMMRNIIEKKEGRYEILKKHIANVLIGGSFIVFMFV